MKNVNNAWIGYAIALGAVVLVCFSARFAFADGAPKQVIDNEKPIAEYQKVIEKNRPAHEVFMDAKQKQAALEKQNNNLGWRTNWETLKPVPIEPSLTKAVSPSTAKQEKGVYTWDGAPDYKNERLAYYQKALSDRGVTNEEHVKLLVAQIIQEAGSLSEDTIGDGGCSLGIPQFNTCVHHKMKAKEFQKRNAEWKDWRHQLSWMADRTASNYEKYEGNVRLAIIAHNCPVCARNGQDSRAGYYRSVASRIPLLVTL